MPGHKPPKFDKPPTPDKDQGKPASKPASPTSTPVVDHKPDRDDHGDRP